MSSTLPEQLQPQDYTLCGQVLCLEVDWELTGLSLNCVPELNMLLRQWCSFCDVLLLFFIAGVCSSVLRKNWKCTVPAAALGSRLSHPGMILLVTERCKEQGGAWKVKERLWAHVVFQLIFKKEKRKYTKSRRLLCHLWVGTTDC